MKLIEGAAAIRKATTTALRTAANLKEQVHLICVSAALHHAKHGDETGITPTINMLCEGMVEVSHANAVRVWFETYSCLTWSAKDKCFKHDSKKVEKVKGDLAAYEEQLIESKPYYKLTKPTPFSPVNIYGPMISQINRYYKLTPEEQADPRNKVAGINEAITFIKRMGMGDKLEIPGEPLVEEVPAMGRSNASTSEAMGRSAA